MITLNRIIHRSSPRIKVDMPYNPEYNQKIRQVAGSTYSASLRCWHVPDDETSYRQLRDLFGKQIADSITEEKPAENKRGPVSTPAKPPTQTALPLQANVRLLVEEKRIRLYLPARKEDISMIRQFKYCQWNGKEQAWMVPRYGDNLARLQQYFEGRIASLEVVENSRPVLTGIGGQNTQRPPGVIFPVNEPFLKQAAQQLVLKGMSNATRRTYLSELGRFLADIKQVPATDFTHDRLRNYLAWCLETVGLSENTIHSRMNALKFLYEEVLKRERFFFDIPRPKKPLQLPRFFSQEEITAIIKSVKNIKHRTMLMLCYSTGMRVSEVVSLKTCNILTGSKCILIEQAKGKKDRMVPLSPVLLVMLREYAKLYKPQKSGYLFAGQQAGEPYNTRSLQLVLQSAKEKAGIMRPGAIHALRHSFATHLLDKGTDISIIQKLLGHNDIKTTLRYLHTSHKDLINIISPLDDLDLG